MLTSRTRTLSDEGQQLFLDGMYVPSRPLQKRTLKNFLFSCFHSPWDDRVDQVVKSCRLSTKSLYGELWENGMDIKGLPKMLDAGITNTVRLILTNDDKKMKKKILMQNYRFFLAVMKNAFDENDHQTAMMLHMALTHMSVQRLDFTRPKKAQGKLDLVRKTYGSAESCYNKHVTGMLSENASEYLPSLIACSMYVNKHDAYTKAFKNMGHHLDGRTIDDIQEHLSMLAVIYYSHRGAKMQLYDQEQMAPIDLYEMSNRLKKTKSPIFKLKRTKKAWAPTEWEVNPVAGKEFKTSAYVTNIPNKN
jgi:hypothetical protein